MDNDDYIINSEDSITIDVSSITSSTIDLDSSTLTLDDSWVINDGTIDLDSLTITLNDPVEFEDNMPSVAKVEDMCNDYPALRKAYENFKTIYKMVHQDWQGRQDDDEHFPF